MYAKWVKVWPVGMEGGVGGAILGRWRTCACRCLIRHVAKKGRGVQDIINSMPSD